MAGAVRIISVKGRKLCKAQMAAVAQAILAKKLPEKGYEYAKAH